MRVLAIDTAGPVVGVAVLEDGRVLGEWSARVSRGAEERLVPAIQEVLQGLRPDLVAVSAGPGTFTGVRVGVATAVGLAQGWGVRVVPVSSLVARAALVPGEGRVLALLDARKERFYAGLFDNSGPLPRALGPEGDLEPREVVALGPAVAVGEGAPVLEAELVAAGCQVAPLPDRCPALALAGIAMVAPGAAVEPEEIRIRYIRPPDAKPPAGVG